MNAPPSPLPPPHAPPGRPLHLTRHFSWFSLLGVILVTAALIGIYRELTIQGMRSHEGRANTDLAHAFINAEWQAANAVLQLGRGASASHPAAQALHREVLTHMRGLSVVKVKLYDAAGITVFSTEARQIGEDKSGNEGLRAALRGQAASQITYRDRFDAFEGVINQRSLIATYVPVRAAPGAPVQGVFELYSDVTGLLAEIDRAQWQVATVALLLQGALYLVLLVRVRQADRILWRHDQERALREAQVQHQALHDALTGLPNRAHFAQCLAQLCALARRREGHGTCSALMFIDLDRFKAINDSLGHDAGDALLQEAARRLGAALRQGDQLFRMGGDEFTVLMPQIHHASEPAHLAQRLQQALAPPVRLLGQDVVVGASIGIALCPDDGTEPAELLRKADVAMYGAKALGRGTHAFYRHDSMAGDPRPAVPDLNPV